MKRYVSSDNNYNC